MTHFFNKEDEKLSLELEKVILTHLPDDKSDKSNWPEIPTLNQAYHMLIEIQRGAKTFDAWDKSKEEEKIYKVIEGIDDASSALLAMHPDIKNTIIEKFHSQISDQEKVPWHPTIDRTGGNDDVADPDLVLRFMQIALIPALEDTLSEIAPDNKLGKNNWMAIAAIDQCRKIWEIRKQKPAPKHLNADGPMANFCGGVFDILSIGIEPTTAFKAWRRTVKD
ncbi:hypothetical protein HGD85_04235 [Rhodobacteraceae bacterium R_SAG10]|nr:hypothetical protein [Rhodobacteraceae bacterium R_SAG10]